MFVGKIREYNQKLSLEESVKSAVKYCIENNILKEFLEKYGKEIVKMILEDISVEDEIEAAREEEREEILGLINQGFLWMRLKHTSNLYLLIKQINTEVLKRAALYLSSS
jgi:hypothetical protein